ncbi:hypothetical protein EGT07_22745 [Herbaspirillum sp. HC18]|nr:hypothetical protein EGT07_22745 [Herbaspirillum sp. HC18]
MPKVWPERLGKRFYALTSLIPLWCESLLSTWLGYQYSMDMKGLWPLALGFSIFANCIYAAATVCLANVTGIYRVRLSALIHSLLATTLFIQAYLYYTMKIDWLAVNNRVAKLTTMERVVHSNWTPWVIYLVFFAVLVTISVGRRKKT